MEQHPVPQNIAAFKFKLFGSLTARQFFTLIIPLSLAALVFFSGLPVIIRMPLSLILGIIAFVIALVPINGQPFEKWAVAFIHAVLSPTQRVWIKDKKIPEFLNVIVTPPSLEENATEEMSSQKKAKLFAYLKTLPQENATPLDVKEQIALSDIDFSASAPMMSTETQRPKPTAAPTIIWRQQPIPQAPQPAPRQYAFIPPPTSAQRFAPSQAEPISAATILAQPTHPKQQPVHVAEQIKIAQTPIQPGPAQAAREPLPIRAKIVPTTAPKLTAKPRISPHAKPYVVHGLEKRLTPQVEPITLAHPMPTSKVESHEYVELIKTPTVNLASDTNYSLDNIITIKTPDNKIKLLHGIGKTRARKLHFAPPENFDISKLPIRGEKRFEVSNELKRHFQFEDTAPEVILPFEKKTASVSPAPIVKTWQKPVSLPTQTRAVPQSKAKPNAQQAPNTVKKMASDASAQKFSVTDFKKDAAIQQTLKSAEIIPLTQTPNVISGQVADTAGSAIPAAVIVIRDSNGIPVRALKTNKLGQFLSATPLSSGTYTIETECEGTDFKPLTLELKNQIVPPIAIFAEGTSSPVIIDDRS